MSFIERYQVLGPLGSGAAGSVLRATHLPTGAEVAVKIAKPTHLRSYRREIFALAGLSHPHIARILDFGEFGPEGWDGDGASAGDRWYSMPLASGGSLEDQDPKSWEEVEFWLLDMLDALASIHARGIAHRDIKPANILFGSPGDLQPGLMIADFGIAWDHRQTRPELAGTPGFMAPEQTRPDGHLGPWTDIYALGMVVWWCVTGTLPFHHPDPRTHLRRSLRLPLPPLKTLFPCPDGLEEWLIACCQRDVGKRMQRISEVRALLPCLNKRLPMHPVAPLPISTPELFSVLKEEPCERWAEQEALWTAVEAGLSGSGTTVVGIDGEEGSGRLSLAIWAGERAHMAGYYWAGLKSIRNFGRWVAAFIPCPSETLQQQVEAFDLTTETVQTWHMTQALAALARVRPMVLLLEDDERFDGVVQRLKELNAPIVVLSPCTIRQADTSISLKAMSSVSLRRVLAQRIVGHEELVDLAVQQADGHPGRAVEAMGHLLIHGADAAETVELGLASAVHRALSNLSSSMRLIIERGAVLGERVGLSTWTKVCGEDVGGAIEHLQMHRLAALEGDELVFRAGVRELVVGLTASRGQLSSHLSDALLEVDGVQRVALLLDAGRVLESNALLASTLPLLKTTDGVAACLSVLRCHEARVDLDESLLVAKVRYLALNGDSKEALSLAASCLTSSVQPVHRLELLRWTEYGHRVLRFDGWEGTEDLFVAALGQQGEQALLGLLACFWGFLKLGRRTRALQVLQHVEACSTGHEDEWVVRGKLDAQRANCLGDVDGLVAASRLVESGAKGSPFALRTAWMIAVEAHHIRGEYEQARSLLQSMKRSDETYRPIYVGYDFATLATIEVSAGELARARRLVHAARSWSKGKHLARMCAYVDIVLQAAGGPENLVASLACIESSPVAVPDPCELRMLEQALSFNPDQPEVRRLMDRHRETWRVYRSEAHSILGGARR